ncbi:similar to Saccharomyces cerevisiae YBR036C CSG2 Endoplasmic reticulum membrane protein [Maudiozyma saulgeensis]|uniref:Similar to Saccharomyces cerevisiae YBR036C CSG2 Endoplasmic reticulum membrane protein n=1 Tax=Maudiozyma saulgeensis TaxID=1789683 RepID=A0A1X7R6Y6_9SACH|nr:similar to Saccharomyces cerevisiae YBR036C CSG2 Endoplasmic reticulum membrane protein [Kazachstania saulgeensis]
MPFYRNINVLWLTAVVTYMIQTRSFENIVGREQLVDQKTQQVQKSQSVPRQGFTVHLAILYLLSWYLLIPFSKLIWSHNETEDTINNNNNKINGVNSDMDDADVDLSEPIELPQPASTDKSLSSNIRYFVKILTMSCFLAITVVTYTLGLGLSPSFDITLIQNCAFFEMTTLLYGVCSVSRNKNVFRNFLIMMLAVISILIVSYTNATCNLLAGKMSVNKETKEVNDPWLFDRLKAGLITGLGSLAIGPFAVWCNQWFEESPRVEKIKINKKNLFYLPTFSIILLLPFLNLGNLGLIVEEYLSQPKFWLNLFVGIVFGVLPNMISIIKLNAHYPNEFITTCNLGVIIITGLFEWICESGQTVIVRWEVISYIFLTLCTITLYFSLRGNMAN